MFLFQMNDLPYQHQTLIIEEFEPDVFRLLFAISFISMNGNFCVLAEKSFHHFELCKFISCLTTLSLSLLTWKGCTYVYNMYVMEHLHPFVKDASVKIKYGSNILQFQSFSGSSLSTFTQAL